MAAILSPHGALRAYTVFVNYIIFTCRNTERIKVCRQKGKKERYAQQAVQNPSFMLVFTNVKIKVEISKLFNKLLQ